MQLRIDAGGEVEVLSTHDQILGGPEGQVYIGCRFPAAPDYRPAIVAEARRVGEVLAGEGVLGSFGIDWLVTPAGDVYLSEINLRMGGTTHPYWMARLAGGASYDPASGRAGRRRREPPLLHRHRQHQAGRSWWAGSRRTSSRLVDDAGLAFDPSTGTGVTLHLLGAVPGYGKLGATCIAGSPEAAGDLYVELVDQLAGG